MVDTIQELRTAAPGDQVNSQVRVVATAVEDTSGGLLVGGQLVTSPYVIDAIGDPHTLADSGIDFPGGPRDMFEDDGASVVGRRARLLDIESVVQPSPGVRRGTEARTRRWSARLSATPARSRPTSSVAWFGPRPASHGGRQPGGTDDLEYSS